MSLTIRILSVLFLAALIFQGCTSTRITASWQNPDLPNEPLSKISVLALTSSNINRISFESSMVNSLNLNEQIAIPSMNMTPQLPQPTEQNRDQLKNILMEQEYDAALTISLLDDTEDTRYVPGESYVVPRTYYNRFGNYYFRTYSRVYTPGYYENTRKIYLESNLYKVETGELLWSAQTETADPASIETMAVDFAEAIATELRSRGFIK